MYNTTLGPRLSASQAHDLVQRELESRHRTWGARHAPAREERGVWWRWFTGRESVCGRKWSGGQDGGTGYRVKRDWRPW